MLSHKYIKYELDDERKLAYDSLKQSMANVTMLAYFDKDASWTVIIAEVSPVEPCWTVQVQIRNGNGEPATFAFIQCQ